ncbi:3-ketodihydrosphingosine reductase-like [Varroa jacobsoni]|uniref:3-dehydrosphinganine reductase n=1 Tax=Varroa destructor TaxID=109461 RepID=A0A7M7L6R4_VARDE|nr:3-ketodihydrosphingosine reductase-like [Varroa destructor]XP_022703675.1 3-ketodihydrosphingosine reductase-like [Varroa jacobsoni]
MFFIFVAGLLGGILLSAVILHKLDRKSLKEKHVLISGGSSGIGLELAKEAFRLGARVTLVARNENNLRMAAEAVAIDSDKVGYVSVDLSSNISAIKKAIAPAIRAQGDIDVLINCAGTAVARYIEETTEFMYRQMMDSNYHTAVNLTKACLSSLERRCVSQGSASIVFLSSMAGIMGVFGYSAYSPAKFAISGFAQTVIAEKQHLGLHVMVVFPPDTETPGFENENVGKPAETVAISRLAGIKKPDTVAKGIIEDLCKRRMMSSFGLDGQLICTAASGMWPVSSWLKLISEIALIAPGRLLGAYLHYIFIRVTAAERAKRGPGWYPR